MHCNGTSNEAAEFLTFCELNYFQFPTDLKFVILLLIQTSLADVRGIDSCTDYIVSNGAYEYLYLLSNVAYNSCTDYLKLQQMTCSNYLKLGKMATCTDYLKLEQMTGCTDYLKQLQTNLELLEIASG